MDISSSNNNNRRIDSRTASFSAYLNVPQPADHEIDVFQAEKYFNMDFENETKHDDNGKTANNHVHPPPDQFWAQVDTAAEESISYRMKKNRASKKQSIFSRFSCKGHCSESDSVRVSESAQVKRVVNTQIAGKNQNKSRSPVSDKTEEQEQFEFPVLSLEEEPRNSIEAFGSVSAARKITMVAWDAIPKAADKGVVSFRTDSGREYETESCASSDLFEIENISGASNNVSGRMELLMLKDNRDGVDSITNIRQDKSGFRLVSKGQRAVAVSKSTDRSKVEL